MKRIVASALVSIVALFGFTEAHAAKPRCTFRVHLGANQNDSSVFATPLRSDVTGKNIFIEKVPTISERDVAAFYPYFVPDGTYGVLFQLDDHGKLALDTLSIEHRGTTLYVFVNGRPVTELQVDRRVSDGRIYVASGITAADLELMKKTWRTIGQHKK